MPQLDITLLSFISKIPRVTALKWLMARASSSCWSISVPFSGCSSKVPRAAGFLLMQRCEELLVLGFACRGEGCSPSAHALQQWPSLPCPPSLHLCGVSPWHRAQPCCPRLVFLRSNGGGQMGGPSRQFPRHQPSWAAIRMERFPWPSGWRCFPGHPYRSLALAIRMEMPWPCCRHSQLHPAPALHLRAEKGGDMAV